MYSNMKDMAFSTPFCTFISGRRYSFISEGSTVNGSHASATMAMAMEVQSRFWRSCTFRLFSSVYITSCGPSALAMYPKVLTVVRRIDFFFAFSISSRSKQMRLHSFAGTNSEPRSAMRPTRSMQFSCTFSWRLRRMGVRRGSRSRIGGSISSMPITFTMLFSAPRILPSTSGYSSPKYSYSTLPMFFSAFSSPHCFSDGAMRAIRSAACMRTLALRPPRRHLILSVISLMYGLARTPSIFSTVPKQFTTAEASSPACSWKAKSRPSMSCSSSRVSKSEVPSSPITSRMLFSTMYRNHSFSSFMHGTSRWITSCAPTRCAISFVVSTRIFAV